MTGVTMSIEHQTIDFVKMQGAGNDYVYINCMEKMIPSPEAFAIRVSDRHYGIGSDGLILVAPSSVADCRMIMFNLDGSEGKMCGNGIRCVAKFMHDEIGCEKNPLTIETKSGIKTVELFISEEGIATKARVNMGKAELYPPRIPANLPGETAINAPIEIGGNTYNVTLVSMGNPHAVVFVDSVDSIDLEEIGPKFEHAVELFPESVNTEFVEIIDGQNLRMRVWERGSGETMACGTGTCATVVAACENGFCKKGEDIRVIVNGGELNINYTDDCVLMTGDCIKVFEGKMEV